MRRTVAKLKTLHRARRARNARGISSGKLVTNIGTIYSKSIRGVKRHPGQSLGVLLGLSAISGAAVWWFKLRK